MMPGRRAEREQVERENVIIERFQGANARELADLLIHPSEQEAEALRDYLGPERFRRLRRLALASETVGTTRGLLDLLGFGGDRKSATQPKLGQVIVLPGLMGSELTVKASGEDPYKLWLHYWWIFRGYLATIQLDEDGRTNADPRTQVEPTAAMNDYYGEMILTLNKSWDVSVFPYDWRLSIADSADRLAKKAERLLGQPRTGPIHLVTHSMGGLVARMFIAKHRQLWDRMSQPNSSTTGGRVGRASHVGRLIQLGTPNHGSHLAVQALAGLAETVQKLALLDTSQNLDGMRRIIASFPGLLQLLPSPEVDTKADRYYLAGTYRDMGLNIPQARLDDALRSHQDLSQIITPDQIIYVAGDRQTTISDVVSTGYNLQEPDGYLAVEQGDGTVTHQLGRLRDDRVETYYIAEDHTELASSKRVLASLGDLLLSGQTRRLQTQPSSRATRTQKDRKGKAQKFHGIRQERVDRFASLVRTAGARPGASQRGTRSEAQPILIGTDPQIRQEILAGIVAPRSTTEPEVVDSSQAKTTDDPREPIAIALDCRYGGIQDLFLEGGAAWAEGLDRPIDAVAVGHYLGVRPSGSELALDRAISNVEADLHDDEIETDLILTQLTQRGTLRGDLAQSFLLGHANDLGDRRTVAVLGLGPPGRCGEPELTVAVRELAWTLGRIGCRHLATVLIGSGVGNLEIPDALSAWFRGLEMALASSSPGRGDDSSQARALEQVTFIEYDAARALEIHNSLRSMSSGSSSRLAIEVVELDPTQQDRLRDQITSESIQRATRSRRDGGGPASSNPIPTRLAVTLQRDPEDRGTPDQPICQRYTFSALTNTAAISEEHLTLDARLVDEVNTRLTASHCLADQRNWGRTLEELLIPDKLATHLTSSAPLVIQLDAASARIAWEMIAQSNPLEDHRMGGDGDRDRDDSDDPDSLDDETAFLGLRRGLTRQLRTSLAGPPEPPPPAARQLRMLVIADPAEDDPLPGAQSEGLLLIELADAFNRLCQENDSDHRVEVEALIGPREATRAEVVKRILVEPYDILHYAGHCTYDERFPTRSGWIFSGGTRLTANELLRLDRAPRLVVSNACESGITPDRSRRSHAKLPATFAEAFFAKGVSDFVCTAWPIGDWAAKQFATTFYATLFGIAAAQTRPDSLVDERDFRKVDPQPMYRAMLQARLALRRSGTHDGLTTWGAYQHYGDPSSRAFRVRARNR